MKRDLISLSENIYDLLIIGGGIYGACVAWDAALRGLSVALLDKGDFGSATSSNSLKIIHGGLRYLQNADLRRMRISIRERMVMMRIAPHLVHPLPFLLPTYGHLMQGREILFLALVMNDLIAFDRNQLKDPQKYLPRGRVVSSKECLQILPGIEEKGLTGGAVWYDCQMYNSERLILSFLLSAAKAGAKLANYVEVTGFLQKGNQVIGVKAKDVLTREEFDIRAKVVVNTSGPWVNGVLSLLKTYNQRPRVLFSKAMNIVVKLQLIPEYAVGIPSKFEFYDHNANKKKGSRILFITPWHNHSLIGTMHAPYQGDPNDFKVTDKEIQEFMAEINRAYPAAGLTREDISFFYGGLLPMEENSSQIGEVNLVKHYQIYDHRRDDGVEGIISVVGVKYTEARGVAEKVIDLVFKKLGKKPPKSQTAVTPIYGGNIERFDDFLTAEVGKRSEEWDKKVISHLVYNYGSEYPKVLSYLDKDPDSKQAITNTNNSPVIKAEVIHGIREEMAQKLSDIIFRRTELGVLGNPGEECLKTCASIMAVEMGWDERRMQEELEEVRATYITPED
jgi:glycerol-3-phosphate dehydrogenase